VFLGLVFDEEYSRAAEQGCSCAHGAVACPDACSDAGDCLSLKQLSKRLAVGNEPIYDAIWDADMVYGCKCRRGFHGYDCSKRKFVGLLALHDITTDAYGCPQVHVLEEMIR
jgi:hypothetical protein